MNQGKIGKFISDCRKEKQLTQEQLAVQLGVTSKSISKWETGNCLPDASKYKPLCEILGITVNELFSGERLNSETENEAKDYLVDLLASRIYDVDCGVSYEGFKNALLRMSETTVMLSKFKSKEAAVEYLVKETGLTFEECSNAYEFYFNINKDSKKYMPDSEPEPPYEGAKPILPVTILDNRSALQNMVEEMYAELPERKPKKKNTK